MKMNQSENGLNLQLREARLSRHWSQKELANHIGTTAVNISRWERRVTSPGPHFRYQLCHVFGKDAKELGLQPDEIEERNEPPTKKPDCEERVSLPIWHMPYRRNPLFTGRDDVLSYLHKMLCPQKEVSLAHAQAITGLGGIGKTQVALEYAYRFRHEYTAVLWIRAETYESLIADFTAIAQLFHLPMRNEQEQQRIVADVKHWLHTNVNWLLILDNAEDLSVVNSFIPTETTGYILLTTRAQSTGILAQHINLEKMSSDEGALLLLRRAKLLEHNTVLKDAATTDAAHAREISELLDGLPLALDQAGGYIDETGCSLSDYVERYQRQCAKLLDWRGRAALDHPQSVAATFSLSFERVEAVNTDAADLLRLCAFLHPDAIPETILMVDVPHLNPTLPSLVADAVQLDVAIATARSYSLLRRDAGTKTLSLHRLVQVVLREGMSQNLKQRWVTWAITALASAFPLLSPLTKQMEVDQWAWCEKLLPHALEALSFCKQWECSTREVSSLLIKTAIYLSERARYEEAEPLFLRARCIQEQRKDQEFSEVATLLGALALFYKRKGKYQEAEPLFLHAKDIWERTLGPECLQVTGPLVGLADLYRYEGKYEEAEALLLQTILILKKILEPDDLQCAYPLYILAHLYAQQGRYEEAEPLYRQAYSRWERALGKNHPQVAGPLLGLAELSRQQGKYEEAEPLYIQAYVLLEQALGSEHLQVSFPLSNLATLYVQQRKYQEAESLYQRVLSIRQQTLGSTHLQVMIPLANMADLYKQQGKYEEAELLLLRTISILEQNYGSEHPQIAYPLHSLADIYTEQGKDADAEALYIRALSIMERCMVPNHPELVQALESVAHFYLKQNNAEKAASFFQRASCFHEQTQEVTHATTRPFPHV